MSYWYFHPSHSCVKEAKPFTKANSSLAARSGPHSIHLSFWGGPVRTSHKCSALLEVVVAAPHTAIALFQDTGSPAWHEGGLGRGGSTGGPDNIALGDEPESDPPAPGSSPMFQRFPDLSVSSESVLCWCMRPNCFLCCHDNCAPAIAAMFFWRGVHADSGACSNSSTRSHTVSKSVPWGRPR